MPIYEFYCDHCHTIYNFFSNRVNTQKKPNCPQCKTCVLSRQMSTFAFTGTARGDEGMADIPFDESKMEKAMQMLTRESEKIREDDPRQAADLMRKLTDMTGMQLGANMEEALSRMEQGEDPESVEADMGDLLNDEDPFVVSGESGRGAKTKRVAPRRDETLYDL